MRLINQLGEPLLLRNKRVVLLRALDQSHEMSLELEKLGAEVVFCPMIKLVPDCSMQALIRADFVNSFNLLIFTSVNGVKFFMQALLANENEASCLANKQIIAIGPKTKQQCEAYGITPQSTPHTYASEGILDLLDQNLSSASVLIPTAEGARDVLPKTLIQRQARVRVLPLYKTELPSLPTISIQTGDYVVFTSPSTATHFFTSTLYTDQAIVPFCIGEITASAVKKYYTGHVHVALKATAQSILEKMIDYTAGQ